MSCNHTYYHYQFEGPDEDLGLAQTAATEWNQCGVVIADVSRTGDENSIRIYYVPTLAVSGEATYEAILYTHVPHTQALIAHEMGHIMGLGHLANEEDLMNASMTSFHVGAADCAALRALHGLPAQENS